MTHTCRWTYKGLRFLNDNYIFPFCIASHTSAWWQPNDNGLNAKFHAKFGKAKKAWRIAHPFTDFDRAAYNRILRAVIGECFDCICLLQTFVNILSMACVQKKLLSNKLRSLPHGKQKLLRAKSLETPTHQRENPGIASHACGQRQVGVHLKRTVRIGRM